MPTIKTDLSLEPTTQKEYLRIKAILLNKGYVNYSMGTYNSYFRKPIARKSLVNNVNYISIKKVS